MFFSFIVLITKSFHLKSLSGYFNFSFLEYFLLFCIVLKKKSKEVNCNPHIVIFWSMTKSSFTITRNLIFSKRLLIIDCDPTNVFHCWSNKFFFFFKVLLNAHKTLYLPIKVFFPFLPILTHSLLQLNMIFFYSNLWNVYLIIN